MRPPPPWSDEAGVALVGRGRLARSSYRKLGGVVPELASRNHVVQVLPVVDEALAHAGVARLAGRAIAVTTGPGLVGALLVGLQVAKALAWPAGSRSWASTTSGATSSPNACSRAARRPSRSSAWWSPAGTPPPSTRLTLRSLSPPRLPPATTRRVGPSTRSPSSPGRPRAGAASMAWRSRATPRPSASPRALIQGTELDFSFSGLKTSLLHHLKRPGVPQARASPTLCGSRRRSPTRSSTRSSRPRSAPARPAHAVGRRGGQPAGCARWWWTERPRTNGWMSSCPPRLCTDNAAMIAVAWTGNAPARRARGPAPQRQAPPGGCEA